MRNTIYIKSSEDLDKGAATDRRHPWGRTIFAVNADIWIDGKYMGDLTDNQIIFLHYKNDLIDHFIVKNIGDARSEGYVKFSVCEACEEESVKLRVTEEICDFIFSEKEL